MEDFVWDTPDFSQGFLFTTGNIAFVGALVLFYVGFSYCIAADRTPRHLFFSVVAVLFGALGM